MIYNMDFLISAMVILLLILWHFLGQKRAEDLNNRVFLFFAVLGTADVVAEFFTNYYITSYNSDMENAAVIVTTIFYLLQALLPVTFIFYIQTLHEQKIISAKKMFISGVPTLVLISVILTNPFTEKLFSFDVTAGYVKGPWYLLMYVSALGHFAVALLLILLWRKKLGPQKEKILLEIFVISGVGVVLQMFCQSLLMTGFGMSLGILALFITINNPNANLDSLTGLYNHLYLTRKMGELIASGKSFHIITVYLYQLKHINRVAGVQGGDSILQQIAGQLGALCGQKVTRITGKRFLVLTSSLDKVCEGKMMAGNISEEYEYYFAKLKRLFDVNKVLDVEDKNIAVPVIISGIINAQKLEESGLIMEYAEYLESL